MYLRITDELKNVGPNVYLISKLDMAEIIDFLVENIGLQIADAEHCVQSEQMGQDTDPKQNPGEKSEAACPYYTHNALLAWHGNYKYCPECGERLRWSGKETDSQPAPSVR